MSNTPLRWMAVFCQFLNFCRHRPARTIVYRLIICVILGGFLAPSVVLAQEEDRIDLKGPLRIAKLLWKANPGNAADALHRTIITAIQRDQWQELRDGLTPFDSLSANVLQANNPDDPLYAPSLAIRMTSGELNADAIRAALQRMDPINDRELVFRVWLRVDRNTALDYFAKSVETEQSNEWPALMIQLAISSEPEQATSILLGRWKQLSPNLHLTAIEPMSSNAKSMQLAIAAVASGDISKDLFNTNQLKKWIASGNVNMQHAIERVWGKIREADNQERQMLVAKTLELLNSGVSGSASRGQAMFAKACSQCHRLHDVGYEVGPNIAGNGRGNMGQLVSNVLDPSLVIGEAFQARTVLTVDGEVVAGLVVAEDERYLKIKQQGGKIAEFDKKEDIEEIRVSSKSLMPEGLETQLSQQELIDLFAYLCILKPLGSAENELIPGTPENFVQP